MQAASLTVSTGRWAPWPVLPPSVSSSTSRELLAIQLLLLPPLQSPAGCATEALARLEPLANCKGEDWWRVCRLWARTPGSARAPGCSTGEQKRKDRIRDIGLPAAGRVACDRLHGAGPALYEAIWRAVDRAETRGPYGTFIPWSDHWGRMVRSYRRRRFYCRLPRPPPPYRGNLRKVCPPHHQ